jgi:hypothetical protein
MSKGPGHVQRDIMAAFKAEPDNRLPQSIAGILAHLWAVAGKQLRREASDARLTLVYRARTCIRIARTVTTSVSKIRAASRCQRQRC